MKIAMIGHKDFPSRAGGVEVVVYELATRLARKGHSVTVFNRGKRRGSNHYTEEGVEVYRCSTSPKKSLNALLYSITATFCAIGKGYDLYHYHAIGPSLMLIVPHFLGKKTVSTVHGLNWGIGRWNRFASGYLLLAERMLARYADEVIVLSEEAQEYFRNKYGRETVIIRNAVTPVETCPPRIIKEKFGLEKDGYILLLARLDQEKGVHYLIDAYRRTDTDCKLVLAGEVPDNAYGAKIKEMAKDDPDIIFTGFVTGDALRELYSNTRLYVLPSEIEGLALTLLEAMSAGAPVLTSDIPENTRVTGRFGKSFVSRDTDSLAEALRECLAAPKDEVLLSEQAAYIRSEYGYDKVVTATEALYRKVTGLDEGHADRQKEKI
ncbi:MAG: glycosyltransferase family 4 protein [Abditibacteriota bacterium]|nr:glycosyltransferase family 4 protein [Abditibacteriota bacterium]